MIKQPTVNPPLPGSDEAIAAGCTCSPGLNKKGAGAYWVNGKPTFWCDGLCKHHGSGKTDCTLKRLSA